MRILAIDTATEVCSVAILEDNNIILEKTLEAVNTHSVALMPLIKEVLSKCNLTINNIDLFACDKGPGSFTGIRIGLSTVKAFCDVTNKPCVGVTSLEGFAYKLFDLSNLDLADALRAPLQEFCICSLLNANHGNAYCGIFKLSDNKLVQIQDYCFDSIDNILKYINTLEKNIFFVGNCGVILNDMIKLKNKVQDTVVSLSSSSPVKFGDAKFIVGIPTNGAPTFINDISYAKIKNLIINNNISAINIGKCAFDKFNFGDYGNSDFLTPLYLKRSSAESKGTN